MIVSCDKCKRTYDDAECWTICPHGPLWATVDAYCREHDLLYCMLHAGERQELKEKHIIAQCLELTPEQREGLTCHVDHFPGHDERHQWYDELEEQGWTKHTEADGSVVYERPRGGGFEKQVFRADGGWGYSLPIDPGIVAQMPVLRKRRSWWQRLRSIWNR